jgi:hypothetical protein
VESLIEVANARCDRRLKDGVVLGVRERSTCTEALCSKPKTSPGSVKQFCSDSNAVQATKLTQDPPKPTMGCSPLQATVQTNESGQLSIACYHCTDHEDRRESAEQNMPNYSSAAL